MTTDCDKLRGRLRDLCRGHDDDGNLVSTPEKRAAWRRYFHGESEQDEGRGKLLTLKQQERVGLVEQRKARTQRLIGWLTFFRLPDDRGVGDTAKRLLPTGKQSPDAGALIKRLLAQCACKQVDAVARLNAEHPYPANNPTRGRSTPPSL